jgi:signal transduction histidine kinase
MAQSIVNSWYFVGGTLVVVAQLALIVGLLVQRGRQRRFEEARSRAILRAIPDLMFVIRRDGTYVDFHARDRAALFVPPDRFLGKKVRDVMPPALATTLMDALERAYMADEPVVVEYELDMDGLRYFEARLVYADPNHVLSIVRDVTEWKRAAQLNRDLAGRLISSQEAERTRIARDLHDDACQQVASAAVDVSTLLRTAETKDGAVHEALSSVHGRLVGVAESLRLLSHDLHPSVMQHIGLVAALEAHCAEVERHYDMQVRFVVESDVEPAASTIALTLYRITQEALRNAARHGHARHTTVTLARNGDGLSLSIADDGQGFDVGNAGHDGGLGLVSIEERTRLVKGRFTIRSQPQQGTTIVVRVPVTVGEDAWTG